MYMSCAIEQRMTLFNCNCNEYYTLQKRVVSFDLLNLLHLTGEADFSERCRVRKQT